MYETQNDLDNEVEVLKAFPDYDWHKLPIDYRLDFIGYGPKLRVIFAEVKSRTNPMDQYPTYIIALSKVMAARQYKAMLGVDSVLIVSWTDKIGWIYLSEAEFSVKQGGRTDRGDWQDVEPVAHFQIRDFNIVGE